METLSLTTARDLASACDDPANPDREAAARAMRERWLSEIEAGLLIPDLGVLEVLGGSARVGTMHTRPLTVIEERGMHQDTTIHEKDLTPTSAADFDEVFVASITELARPGRVAHRHRLIPASQRGAPVPPRGIEQRLVVISEGTYEDAKARIQATLGLSHETGWHCA